MHDPPFGQGHGRLIWLFSGTGEGPLLARAWLDRGWRLEVFVVSQPAARAYPAVEHLRVRVGAVGDRQALVRRLQEARFQASAPLWVVDATHPFASTISADLAGACADLGQALLRLVRPDPEISGGSSVLRVADWAGLASVVPAAERVLLAIGARHLPSALVALPGCAVHARVLPTAEALALALAAGISSARLAALRPGEADRAILAALCRQWAIGTVVARASGGPTERSWRQIQEALGLRLVLLERPPLAAGGIAMAWSEALELLSPDAVSPGPRAIVGGGDPAG